MEYTLKQWRGIMHVSQAELAAAINRTQITISHWETGKSIPRYDDMLKMRAALGLGPEDVIVLPME